jgi:hypothetical protein
MATLAECNAEIERLRKWRHDLLEDWLILQVWRQGVEDRLITIEGFANLYGPRIDQLASAAQIAEAVTTRMREQGPVLRWRSLAGVLAALVSLCSVGGFGLALAIYFTHS